VLALQQRLKALGYWLGTPDGSFGSLTQQAVWALQKSAGLQRDGVVGPKTMKALEAGTRPRATLNGNGHPVHEEDQDGVPTKKIGSLEVKGEGPLIVREKTHVASPMTLDQALYEMELVGHDFYLFVDSETKEPSVVYRRHAYDDGVIHLSTDPMVAQAQSPAPGGTLGG